MSRALGVLMGLLNGGSGECTSEVTEELGCTDSSSDNDVDIDRESNSGRKEEGVTVSRDRDRPAHL
ncbi:MAG: hypothetical protein KVP17_002079 [Porospora cf. gigantea B]|uniref:uncharacterized protein n=1 Tax=Porospora cf. gigantea B TaxID=2853592 RepID=UPI003571930F|nr:MAG: hypothetical protein KVP17_002079 [Porospora cf. gigantea B]